MPTNKYIKGEKYFTIVSESEMNTQIPNAVRNRLGYDLEVDLTLADCVHWKRQLDNGDWVVSLQLSPNHLLGTMCVEKRINNEDFVLAKQQFGKSDYYILEEVEKMQFKRIELV
jgi:hypothetical protein